MPKGQLCQHHLHLHLQLKDVIHTHTHTRTHAHTQTRTHTKTHTHTHTHTHKDAVLEGMTVLSLSLSRPLTRRHLLCICNQSRRPGSLLRKPNERGAGEGTATSICNSLTNIQVTSIRSSETRTLLRPPQPPVTLGMQ
jgi:hypothetical protein